MRDDDRPIDAVVRHHRAEKARERLATGIEATGEAVVGERGLQQGQAGWPDGDRGGQCRCGDHSGAETMPAQMDTQLRPLAADLIQQMAEAGADRPGPRLHLVVGRVVHEPFRGSDDPGREIAQTGGFATGLAQIAATTDATGAPARIARRGQQQDRHVQAGEQLLRVLAEELLGSVRLARRARSRARRRRSTNSSRAARRFCKSPKTILASSISAARCGGRPAFSRSSLAARAECRHCRRWRRRRPG